jgi:enoyl-CoA hydratase/carnithine racemase
MSNPRVELDIADGIALVTLDHPPVNAVALETTRLLHQHVETIEADPTVRAVVFTGAGRRAFCAGSDIREFPKLAAEKAIVSRKLDFENRTYSRIAHMARPTVAAVEGLALGGGMELAACCDRGLSRQRRNASGDEADRRGPRQGTDAPRRFH